MTSAAVVDPKLRRDELCSSARTRVPQLAQAQASTSKLALAERSELARLRARVPTLELIDEGALTKDGEALMKSLTPRRLLEEAPAVPAPASNVRSTSPKSPQAPQRKDGAANSALNSSSFMSSPRWGNEARVKPAVPPIGHYWPRYAAVEHSVRGGKMGPLPAPPKRREAASEKVSPQPLVSLASQSSFEITQQNPNGTSKDITAASPDGEDSEAVQGKAGPPQPGRYSTWAFKSRIPVCPPPKYVSAAPDKWYWPYNECCVSSARAPSGPVMSKQTPRPPLTGRSMADPGALTLPTTLTQRTPVIMQKQVPRELSPLRSDGAQARKEAYDIDECLRKVVWPRDNVVDFTKQASPRDKSGGMAAARVGVSVEEVESLPIAANLPNARSPDFDRMRPRDPSKPKQNDFEYEVSYSITDHRPKDAKIQPNTTGHKSLFCPHETDRCGQYDPQLTATRPRMARDVYIARCTPRKQELVPMMDVTYDPKEDLSKPRIKSVPHMSTGLSRNKRNATKNLKSCAADVVYTYDLHALRPRAVGGALPFDKQAERDKVFAGRNSPSFEYSSTHPRAPPVGSYDYTLPSNTRRGICLNLSPRK